MEKTLGGKRLGAEGDLPKVHISEPNSSNFNLSRANRFTAGPGILYPALVERALPGDTWNITTSGLFKTIPTVGPVFGTFKTQLDLFFIPDRLYNPILHNNPLKFDPNEVAFPMLRVHGTSGKNGAIQTLRGRALNHAQIHPTSLLHRLGISGIGRPNANNTNDRIFRDFNAVPILGYYDIFKNYYANTQEENYYILLGQEPPGDFNLEPVTFSSIDEWRLSLLKTDGKVNTLINDIDGVFAFLGQISHLPASGLVVKTHLSDRFHAWLNTSTLTAINAATNVGVIVIGTKGTFSVDSLRLANKVNQMLQKTMVSGGRWTDWLQVQYGKTVRMQSEQPEWIGSEYGEITFDDVTSTTSNDELDLGSLAGKGNGSWSQSSNHYRTNESGYIMGIFSITPRVDYSQGNKAWSRIKNMGQQHIPALDAIGFQDLVTDEFAAFDSLVRDDGVTAYTSIGKQPAWTEYMTATNEVHGDFADSNKLGYMVLDRNYSTDTNGNINNATAYINPKNFNYIFADARTTAENFWIQLGFNVRVNRVMSKKVMPSL